MNRAAMQDFWNDPPEEDTPYCTKCENEMDIRPDGSAICRTCGNLIGPPSRDADPVPVEEKAFQNKPEPKSKWCPHGKRWSECNDCYVASDMAYDANRERK